jgi:HSP20 family protein
VDSPQRKYYKEVKLPAKVKVKEAKTGYKNGVLEVTFPKLKDESHQKGEPIHLD